MAESKPRRPRRPEGMTPEEAFHWYMPGDPPDDGCWIWAGITNKHGYGHIHFKRGPKCIRLHAHRLSHEIFNGPIPDGMIVRHTCDVTSCVQPKHLLIGTQADNVHDMLDRKRHRCVPQLGSEHHRTTLNEADVLQMRELHATGGYTYRELGEMFGVTLGGAWAIIKRKNWTHI